jgi:hypothetical protein
MDLEHPDFEPFEPSMRRLIEGAFSPPRLIPKSVLLGLRWVPGYGRQRFIADTLAAYGDLQREVAPKVVSLETEARALSAALKAARRARVDASKAVLERKIEIVRNRQLILRRMLDAVVYIVCDQYVWFIRRLALEDRVRPIDPDTLPHIVEEAARLNRQDPYTLFLASDLTTSVQIGDFVEVSADAPPRWAIRLVEVKEGKINEVIIEQLARKISPEDIRQTMGENAAQQAERMLQQQKRLKNLSDIVRDSHGIDPRTGVEMRRTADAPPTPGYQPELRDLIETAARYGQHLITLDGCLTLAAARVDAPAGLGLDSAIHNLFHHNHPEAPCLLSGERAQEELDLLKREPPAIDLVEHANQVRWAAPVFSWGTLDRVCDLLTGRIKVYAQLDTTRFMERAAANFGIKMGWVTGRRAEMLKQSGTTMWISRYPRASAMLVELPDGTRFKVLSGSLARIFFEQAKPDTILRYLPVAGAEARKAQEDVKRRSLMPQGASGEGKEKLPR